MKSAIAKIAFGATALLAAVPAGSMCGSLWGAKAPVAIAAFLWLAFEYGIAASAPAAVFAGGAIDALSGTPVLCSVSMLLFAALPVQALRARHPDPGIAAGAAATAAAAVFAAAWMHLWTGCPAPFAGALVLGALSGAAVFAAMRAARNAFSLGAEETSREDSERDVEEPDE